MIRETLSMLASMYDAIGPGFLLALALPLFLVALMVLLRMLAKGPEKSSEQES